MTIIIGDEILADEVMYCPNCGVEINYENYPPNFCPNCGNKISLKGLGRTK
jgi:DNA-directed RNA polymerase subunit RPC12/RpoP